MKIFISHSSLDVSVASALIELLRFGLNLRSEEILCSSVDGYRLPAGGDVNDFLRKEVYSAELFLSLITPSSMKSIYVLFELGARWGSGKNLIPLLASGATTNDLLGTPLSALNSLSCDMPAQMLQLINEAGKVLKVSLDLPQSYHKALTDLVDISSKAHNPKIDDVISVKPMRKNLPDEEMRILCTLASDEHVDKDREIHIDKLSSLLSIKGARLEVIIDELKSKGLVDQLSNHERHIGLTKAGKKLLVGLELI